MPYVGTLRTWMFRGVPAENRYKYDGGAVPSLRGGPGYGAAYAGGMSLFCEQVMSQKEAAERESDL